MMYYNTELFKSENLLLYRLIIYMVIIYFIGFCIGSAITYNTTMYKFKKQAIEHGYAEYDNKTGEWEWK